MLTTVKPLRKQCEWCLAVHDLVHSFLQGIASKECHSQGQLLLSKTACGVEGALWEMELPNLYQNLIKFLERKLAARRASRGLAAFKTKCLPLCKKSCVSWWRCKAVVLNPWDLRPLWGLYDPFTGSAYPIAFMSDIYVMVYNSSKITVMREQWSNFDVGGHHNSLSHQENKNHN